MVKHFADAKTGCVSGEKRIETDISNNASTAGEGIYWKYESLLKKWDAELNSSVGAAGELVAFRSALFEALPEDTLVDDFMQSMQIAAKGYRIVYEPKAFAVETASLNVKEELKRKIRISAGNWQAIKRLSGKLRFSKTPVLFFQYISHKVLRWAVAPFLLILIFFLTISLAINGGLFYQVLLYIQSVFYLIAVAGYLFEHTHTRLTVFFIPYYFCVMNYAAIAGLVKLLSGQQTANWEKAKRTP
jgi:cellulose synthase/poly-beta-1,6-N-acetylglucosamine synthase-like glycosyltransferase